VAYKTAIFVKVFSLKSFLLYGILLLITLLPPLSCGKKEKGGKERSGREREREGETETRHLHKIYSVAMPVVHHPSGLRGTWEPDV
jgi:hypothetical protein